MRRLFIAEKPKMAQAIAAHLSGNVVRKDGYLEVGNDWVSWCIGHVLEQMQPEAYGAQYAQFPGTFATLPILPAVWKVQASESKKGQVAILKKLIGQAGLIVNAGDPGREGQLIVDEVLEFLGNKSPVQRILLPALDPASVKKALANLVDNRQFTTLYEAALGRQRADWLVGMNLSRAYTIRGNQQGHRGVLSIGRVQTPTLAIVVRRDQEIESFVSMPYWTLTLTALSPTQPDLPFVCTWLPPGATQAFVAPQEDQEEGDEEPEDEEGSEAEGVTSGTPSSSQARPAWCDASGRILKKEEAERIVQAVRAAPSGVIVDAVFKAAEEQPPLPFELTGVQSAVIARTGASAQDVLTACQRLYERGYASYPRTDCAYLPLSQHSEGAGIGAAIAAAWPQAAPWAVGADWSLKSRAFNDAKVGEHHALIPTAVPPVWSDLSHVEQAVYETIARAYLAQFYPVCKVDKSTLIAEVAQERWIARGRVVRTPGWRVLYGTEGAPADAPALPHLKVADPVDTKNPVLHTHETKPPPRFTEGTLLKAMKYVAKLVKDPAERKMLKNIEGIGRSATRASIIETLFKRTFLTKQGKSILSSPLARILVSVAPQPLVDPGLTARWEAYLDMIAQNKLSLAAFMQTQEKWVRQLVAHAQAVPLPPLPASAPPAYTSASRGGKAAPKKAASTGSRRASSGAASKKRSATSSVSGGATPEKGSTCSACKKGTLQERTVRAGQHAGKTFLGCSGYPVCKHSVWPT